MKKRFLASLLSLCLVIGLTPMTALAATISDENLPSYLREQDEGLFVAGQKIESTGYYTFDEKGTLTQGSEDDFQVYANLEDKTITLKNASITVETPETNTVNDKPDPNQDPPGVLCETKGTAGSDSGTVFQYLSGYSLLTAGIAVLNQPGDWTITLEGANSINVDSKFAVPYRNAHHAMPVYGVYIPGGSLTITGTGSMETDVANNQNSRAEGIGYCNPATGIYAGGLEITQATVEVSVSTDRLGGQNRSIYYPSTISNYFGAVVSTQNISVSGGAEVAISDNVNSSVGMTAVGTITISDEEAQVSITTSGASSYALGSSRVAKNTDVTITSGTVCVETSGGGSVGVAGKTVAISGEDTQVEVTVTGDGSTGVKGTNLSVSAKDVTVTAKGEESAAVSGTTVTLAAGTYNTEIPEDYLAEDHVVVNGTVTTDPPDEVAAFIGSNLFTGPNGGDLAIASVSANNGVVWLNVNTTADKTGLLLGNKVTIYVAQGKTYSGSFTGENVVVSITADGQETKNGVTYNKYIYTMVPDPSTAPIKIVSADGTVSYYNDFDTYKTGVSSNLADGDTIVLLADINLTPDIMDTDRVYINKSVTLDLNGKQLTSNQDGFTMIEVYKPYGSTNVLTIVDSEGGGAVTASGSYSYAVSGIAVIEAGTFTAETCLTSGGTGAVIKGGTFSGDIRGDWDIRSGDFTKANVISTGSPKILTDVPIGGDGVGATAGTDEVFWKLEPNDDDAVTVDGETWNALTLTIYGSGALKSTNSPSMPWYYTRVQITRVVIAEGITALKLQSLQETGNLNSLTLPEGLTEIGIRAFQNTCVNGKVTIPASVTTIGSSPFLNSQVTAFEVAEGSGNYQAIDGVLLTKDGATLVAYPDGTEPFADYTVPNDVKTILNGAFAGSELSSLKISTDLTSAYTLPTFAETDGYVFKGWYADEAYNSKITSTTTSAYAKWVSEITLDANGGEVTSNAVEVVRNAKLGTLSTPTRDGYTFRGWNTAADGSGEAVTAETIPAGGATYYAVWSKTQTVDNVSVDFVSIPDQEYTGSAIEPTVYYMKEGALVSADGVSYRDNTDCGTAYATVTVNDQEFTVEFKIVPATVDMTGVSFLAQTFPYDGQEHSLAITGTLPEGVSVIYEGNGRTNAGSQNVTAKFTASENYASIPDMTAKLTITRAYITIAADSKTMYVNEAVPELTYTVISQVTGEPVDVELGFVPDLTCSADGTTKGRFSIQITGTSYKLYTNYVLSSAYDGYQNGTLTVMDRSSGSSSGSSAYSVTASAADNGTVTVTPKSASKGTTVTITVQPDDGYELAALTVTDANGNQLALTDKGGGKYTFVMPASKVEIKASFVETETPVVVPGFTDVPAGAYYADAVAWAVENSITLGTSDTTFSPDQGCTRAQVVTFLWRAAGCPAAECENPFTDVLPGSYYYDAVLWAVEKGVTIGTSSTTFSPEDVCSRGQIVTFLWRNENQPTASTTSSFADVDSNAYYAGAVEWAAENAITVGTNPEGTLFSPNDDCTRAQIVTFLYRYMA